jgi:hypothetical protein
MDPFTISAAIAFFGAVAVAVVAITIRKIYQWFQARGKIKAENSSVLAFTLADRINAKKYVEVPGVFEGRPSNTRIVQGFYDVDRDKIIEARALASATPPEDRAIITRHEEGEGLVIYT